MLRFDSCPNCFAMLGGSSACPECGYNYNEDKKQPKGVLAPFTLLGDRYIVGRVLGKGGFGVTYIAKDIEDNTLHAVKEYMPAEFSHRDEDEKTILALEDRKARYVFEHGREKFVQEAKTLYALKNNPAVVNITDYFSENNTAYLVMEYLDGTDLRRMSKKNGGKISPDLAKKVLVTIAVAMQDIHKKSILHRDLSPENIYYTKNHDIKLIDFGAARDYVKTQNSGMSILLKPGFAPPEQYSSKGGQGPWTDVYSLCSTFYTLVSGKSLIDAMYRYRGESQPTLYELGCPVTKRTSDVIEKGMALECSERYQNFTELLDDLDMDPEEMNIYSFRNRQAKKEEAEKAQEKEEKKAQEEVKAEEEQKEETASPATVPDAPAVPEKPAETDEAVKKQDAPEEKDDKAEKDDTEEEDDMEEKVTPEKKDDITAPKTEESQAAVSAPVPSSPFKAPAQEAPAKAPEQEHSRPPMTGAPIPQQNAQPYQGTQPRPNAQPYQAAQPRPNAQPYQAPQPRPNAQPYQAAQPRPNAQPYQAAQPRPNAQPYQAAQPRPNTQPYQAAQQRPTAPPVQGAKPVQNAQPAQNVPVDAAKRGGKRAYLGLLENGRITTNIMITPDNEIKIGRSKSCDLVITDDTDISRVHCTLKYDSKMGKMLLMDTSSNGTFFDNHQRLKKSTLYNVKPGCRFYLVRPSHMLVVYVAAAP